MNDFLTLPCIVVIAYFIGFTVKTIVPNNKANKYIPIVCGFVGAALSIAIYITIPQLIPADNWATAVAIGILSGLAATGANQIKKQLTK